MVRRKFWLCRFVIFLLAACFLLLGPRTTSASQVTLAWDSTGGTDTVGYKLYYGTSSRNYSTSADVGNAITYTLTGLLEGQVYYFTATAYDAQGQESPYSNEVLFSTAAAAPAASTASDGNTSSGTDTVSRTPVSTTSAGSTDGGTDTATRTPASTTSSASAASGDGGSDGGGGGGGGAGCFIATAAFGSYVDPHVVVLRSFRDTFLLTNRTGSAFVSWYYATSPDIARTIRKSEALKACVRIMLVPIIGFSYLCLTFGFLPTLFGILLMCITFLLMAGKYFPGKASGFYKPNNKS
jgi:hypothetical protein